MASSDSGEIPSSFWNTPFQHSEEIPLDTLGRILLRTLGELFLGNCCIPYQGSRIIYLSILEESYGSVACFSEFR